MDHEEKTPFPGIGNIEFLQDEFIWKYSEECGVDSSSIEEVLRLRDMLLLKTPFVLLLWEFHDLLYRKERPCHEVINKDPKLDTLLGDALRGVFFYLLVLSAMPLMKRRYEERAWPDEMRLELMQDFSVWNAHHKRNYGTPGISEFFWFQGHLNLTLIGCGRLQFNTKLEFPSPCTVFRSKQTGKVLALTDNGDRYTGKGILDDLQEEPSEGSWVSSFVETPQAWTGNPVTPEGFAKSATVTLAKSEWEIVLQKGDPIINTHIPESGPLLSEECGKSLCRARDFFAEYLSDYPWKAFFCDSWLLDPQLAEILEGSSNILAFQKRCYMLPFPGEADTVFRCFGIKGSRDGVATVPLRSSLQQKMALFLKSGRRFHYGSGIILRGDLEKLIPYRSC